MREFPSALESDATNLNERLHDIHERILEMTPTIDRIACALYDPASDALKTFINSTRDDEPLAAYEYPLADSQSLSALATTRATRVLDHLPTDLAPDREHSSWVLSKGYLSSFTIPLFYRDRLMAFLFFDSKETGAFTPEVQRELRLYSQVITMAIANELVMIRSVLGAVELAKDFTELRDLETGAHLERMSRYSRLIAHTLAVPLALPDEFVENVFLYAPLHDIGKIGVPDKVLLKPGPLDAAEWEVMKSHTTKGREMVDSISAELEITTESANRIMTNIVELHHEALDGSGYPHGLRGEEIPLESRIVAVADIFDALTSARPYKSAWSIDDAAVELELMVSKGKLDPDCVSALTSNLDDAGTIRDSNREDG